MTRSLAEFATVTERRDLRAIWAVGVHPGLVRAQRAFDGELFTRSIQHTPFVGEVGLDASSRVPMGEQIRTLRQILEVLVEQPRIVSIHTAGAQLQALRLLHDVPTQAAVLHWWTGSPELTDEAVRLGCYFSVPPAVMPSSDLLRHIPPERLLPETDHPYGDRFGPLPRRPGNTTEVETKLAKLLDCQPAQLRQQHWANLATLCRVTGVLGLFPETWHPYLQS